MALMLGPQGIQRLKGTYGPVNLGSCYATDVKETRTRTRITYCGVITNISEPTEEVRRDLDESASLKPSHVQQNSS